MKKFLLGLTCFLFFPGANASSQSMKGGPSDSLGVWDLQFNRSLQTFLWNGRVNAGQDLGVVTWDFRQTARSRLIRSTRDAVQDELGSRLTLAAPLTGPWSVAGLLFSTSLTDNQQLGLGNLSRQRVVAGPRYVLGDGSSIVMMGGYEWASQEQIHDRGFSTAGHLRLSDVPLEEFLLNLTAGTDRASTEPRTQKADTVSIALIRQFSSGSLNRLSFLLTNQQREFYVSADSDVRTEFGVENNVFRREAREVGLADTLEVSFSSAALHFSGGILSRSIDRGYRYKSYSTPSSVILDNRINETYLNVEAGLLADLTDWLATRAVWRYEEREEQHRVTDDPHVPNQTFQRQDQAAKRLSNLARRTTMGLDLFSRVTEKDSLNFKGSASILRYDTPDSLNTDDRDELLVVAGVEGVHRFHRSLSLSILAEATLSHLVYLHRLQSANNYWNRIFRLKSRVDYVSGPAFRTSVWAEVLANYTVYDFEEQVLSVRSFSFRQASWSDSTVWRIGKRITASLLATIRVYERGILKWKEFTERPENYFVEQSFWPQIAASLVEGLTASVGYRFFSQTKYRYVGRSKRPEQTISNSGPTVLVAWRGVRGGYLTVEGWREAQHVDGQTRQVYSNMSITVGMTI